MAPRPTKSFNPLVIFINQISVGHPLENPFLYTREIIKINRGG